MSGLKGPEVETRHPGSPRVDTHGLPSGEEEGWAMERQQPPSNPALGVGEKQLSERETV